MWRLAASFDWLSAQWTFLSAKHSKTMLNAECRMLK